jgi:hypothetical protein
LQSAAAPAGALQRKTTAQRQHGRAEHAAWLLHLLVPAGQQHAAVPLLYMQPC